MPKDPDYVAIILAAGAGKRMKSALAKVLHRVCGLSLIEHVISAVESKKASKVIAVIPDRSESIRSLISDRAEVAVQKKPRGTGHALLQAKKLVPQQAQYILVVCGDTPLIKKKFISSFYRRMRQKKHAAFFISFFASNPHGYGRVIRDSKSRFICIKEEKSCNTHEKKIHEVNSGIYLFDKKILFEYLPKVKPDPIKKEIYLTDVLKIIHRHHSVGVYQHDREIDFLGVNTRKDLSLANEIMNKEIIDHWLGRGVSVFGQDTVFIDKNVRIDPDVTIYPYTMIEGPSQIKQGAKIGPFAHIRPGTRIASECVIGNFVEVVRSTIGNGSFVKHLTYLGDSDVGSGVNIGAGTITANFDGKHKHSSVIKNHARIGSGTILIAPSEIGEDSETAAGAVVKKGTKIKAGEIYAGIPAKRLRKKNK